MLQLDISIPVYFAPHKPQLEEVIGEISRASNSRDANKKRESALAEIANSISANGYQIVVQGAVHAVNKQSKIPILQGEMVKPVSKNSEADSKLPLIMVVAHLDTFGLINQHLSNNDVAVLLSLVDLFSKLNNGLNTSPKYRLLFLVTESGALLNYQGTKKWLDVNIDENALSQVRKKHLKFMIQLSTVFFSFLAFYVSTETRICCLSGLYWSLHGQNVYACVKTS